MRALAAAGYRTVAPNLRGYPPTSVPDGGYYDAATLTNDVVALIEQLGGGPVHYVGHDWGAAIGYRTVAAHPELFARSVQLAIPHPLTFATMFLDPAQIRGRFHFWFLSDERPGGGRHRRERLRDDRLPLEALVAEARRAGAPRAREARARATGRARSLARVLPRIVRDDRGGSGARLPARGTEPAYLGANAHDPRGRGSGKGRRCAPGSVLHRADGGGIRRRDGPLPAPREARRGVEADRRLAGFRVALRSTYAHRRRVRRTHSADRSHPGGPPEPRPRSGVRARTRRRA
ncbi:MAG: alpha/beta fold hydrolase [Actinomycetota bacterium]